MMKRIKIIMEKLINKVGKIEDFEMIVENEEKNQIESAETFTVLQAMYFA